MVEIGATCPLEPAAPRCCDKPGWRPLGSRTAMWGEAGVGGMDRGFGDRERLVGPARCCPFRPPLLPISSVRPWAGLTDLNPRVRCYLKGSIGFLESSLETHIVFTISREKYAAMSAGEAPWTSNHPRRVIFWRRGSCCSWIPVLEQWHWNQARQPPREGVSFRNHRRRTLLTLGGHPGFQFLAFQACQGVPCLFVPYVVHTPSANSRTHCPRPTQRFYRDSSLGGIVILNHINTSLLTE